MRKKIYESPTVKESITKLRIGLLAGSGTSGAGPRPGHSQNQIDAGVPDDTPFIGDLLDELD